MGLVADAVTHHFQRFTDHDKGIRIQSTDQPFEPAQFAEGDDRIQDVLIFARKSSFPFKDGHTPLKLLL